MTAERFDAIVQTLANIIMMMQMALGKDPTEPNTCAHLATELAAEEMAHSKEAHPMAGAAVKLARSLDPAFHYDGIRDYMKRFDREVGGINDFCTQHGLRVPAVLRDVFPSIHERHTE